MGFENTFGQLCWRCKSSRTKDITNGYTLCEDCGYIYHTLLDYSHDFETSDNKHIKELEDEQKKYGGLRGYSSINGLGLAPSFAEEVFTLIKKADTLCENGFSTADGNAFAILCYTLDKYSAEPDDYQINLRKNRWDDSHPNIIDTLGCYGLNEEKRPGIQLCPQKITEKYSESIVVLVVLHEIMHAAMDTGSDPDGSYWYYKEEAYANAFALKLLQGTEWFAEAIEFVKKQPAGYNTAEKLVDEQISMESWREEKLNPKNTSEEKMRIWEELYIQNN